MNEFALTYTIASGRCHHPENDELVSAGRIPTVGVASKPSLKRFDQRMVGFIEVPPALGEPGCWMPLGPQIGAVGPKVILPGVGVHLAGIPSVQLKCGMGPRVEPSHSSQPMAQPLENPARPARRRQGKMSRGGRARARRDLYVA